MLAFDGAKDDNFGSAVAVWNNIAVISSPGDDDQGRNSGSCHVYRFNGTDWVFESKLVASDGASNDSFGYSVAVHEETILVGAYLADSPESASGAAYVFEYNGSTWVETQKLQPPESQLGARFGCSVSVNGSTAVVGAEGSDILGNNSGCGYVFRKEAGIWSYETTLLSSFGAEYQYTGHAVKIYGDMIAIGAHGGDGLEANSGVVYTFRRQGENWEESNRLIAPDGANNDKFGFSLGMSSNGIIIGAYGHDNETGVAYVSGNSDNNCNGNDWADICDITAGTSFDCNNTGKPDECETISRGDFDADTDIDLADYIGFTYCMAGPGVPPVTEHPGCAPACLAAFDFDDDGDIDIRDAGELQKLFNTGWSAYSKVSSSAPKEEKQ